CRARRGAAPARLQSPVPRERIAHRDPRGTPAAPLRLSLHRHVRTEDRRTAAWCDRQRGLIHTSASDAGRHRAHASFHVTPGVAQHVVPGLQSVENFQYQATALTWHNALLYHTSVAQHITCPGFTVAEHGT